MKIICVGRNYGAHIKELNNAVPEDPVLFLKPETALLLPPHNFIYPDFSNDVHYELELVLRVGKSGKNIAIAEVDQYIDAITVGIDFTARDIQEKCKKMGLPWEKAKAFDGSALVGKFIAKTPLNKIDFHLTINKKRVQQGNTQAMIFPCDILVNHISQFFTLMPGDLIFTGTPSGVGPVAREDFLEGYLNNEKLFECHV